MLEEFGVINLWTYVLGVIFIILVPGPNTIFVLSTSIRRGVKHGYQAAIGVFIGDAVLMFCAFIGVASLIQTSPMLFMIIKYVGAAYLIYLGLKTLYLALIKKANSINEPIKINQESSFKKALVLSLTNPKAILFFVSFFVQFVDPNYTNTATPFLILACILETISFMYLSVLIIGGASIAAMFNGRVKLAKLANSMVGTLFVWFGGKLIAVSS